MMVVSAYTKLIKNEMHCFDPNGSVQYLDARTHSCDCVFVCVREGGGTRNSSGWPGTNPKSLAISQICPMRKLEIDS